MTTQEAKTIIRYYGYCWVDFNHDGKLKVIKIDGVDRVVCEKCFDKYMKKNRPAKIRLLNKLHYFGAPCICGGKNPDCMICLGTGNVPMLEDIIEMNEIIFDLYYEIRRLKKKIKKLNRKINNMKGGEK